MSGPGRSTDRGVPMDSVSDLVLLILYANGQLHRQQPLSGTTRLQKLLFLVTQAPAYQLLKGQGRAPTLEFVPYKMGPFTPDLYDAVDLLTNFSPQLVIATQASLASPDQTELHRYVEDVDLDRSWPPSPRPATYSLSSVGEQLASQLWHGAPRELRDVVADTVKKYATMPIRELLRDVYSRFPLMTERSEIKDGLGLT